MVSKIQAMLRERQTIENTARDVLRDNQRLSGILCDIQGFTTGSSKNNLGNQAYVAIGGGVDANGDVSNTQVINAWLSNPNITGQPGEPVIVEYNREQKRWFVTGIDPVAVASSGSSVQYYNHMNPNRMFVDSGFILDFLSRPVISTSPSTLVEVKPGLLYNGTTRHEFDGTQVNLATYVTSAGTHAIAQLWYDPATDSIQVTTSTEQTDTTAFDDTDWAETITAATRDWLPLQSYTVNDSSDTLIDQSNLLRDNRPIYTLPGGNSPVGYPDPVTSTLSIIDGYTLIVESGWQLGDGGKVTLGDGSKLVVLPPLGETSSTRATATKTTDYTITAQDSVVLVDASSGTVTITLPDASTVSGQQYDVFCADATNLVQVATTSSQTINGSTSNLPLVQYESVTLFSDGSNWIIL